MTRMRLFHRIALVVALIVATISPALSQSLSPGVRSILFGSGCPSAVRIGGACPSVSADFTKQSYWAQGYQPLSSLVSVARASSHLCQYASGVWISVGANVPCITDQGFLIEEARTNKCTNFNANPTDLTNVTKSGDAAATLTVVDDTAALLAAGLQNIATSGKVYKLDNSLGVATANATFGGTVGNTNTHIISAYVRGTGTAGVRGNVGSRGSASVTLTTNYMRVLGSSFTPSATTDQGQVFAIAGATAFFILNDLEEGAFVTSPIVIAGASAIRAADVPQLIGPAATAALAAKAAFFQTSGVAGTIGRLADFNGGAFFAIASTTTVSISDGTNSKTATLGSGTTASTVKTAYGMDTATLTVLANGGTKQATATSVWAPTAPIYLGNRSAGDRALNGYMQRFALSPSKGIFDTLTAP